MQFVVLPYNRPPRADRELAGVDTCFLLRDNWDDYSLKTTFDVIYFDGEGTRLDLGRTKIMLLEMNSGYTPVNVQFSTLTTGYASLGQDQSYYESIMSMVDEKRVEILTALRDVVWDPVVEEQVRYSNPFNSSLTRSVTRREIEKFRAIIHEEARLTPFHFMYHSPEREGATIEIEVEPAAMPPSNIHVIIGRNGVGKTTLLRRISDLLRTGSRRSIGHLEFMDAEDEDQSPFANLVTVAFSAFDEFDPPTSNEGTRSGIIHSYIGLRKQVRVKGGGYESRNKTPSDLRSDFIASTLTCLRSSRRQRWLSAMRVLEGDPLFASLRLTELAEIPQEEIDASAGTLFNAASSGHKIVLLTMTRLVELVSERTLVLIDEPEAHLHPPLAASFIRALSGLLSTRNGVAILATHSPVILQEIPSNCVSLLFRTSEGIQIERPQLQTFAENVSLLNREIFRVELTESGYHNLINEAVKSAGSVEDVFETFGGKLGSEGRSLVRALWQERSN